MLWVVTVDLPSGPNEARWKFLTIGEVRMGVRGRVRFERLTGSDAARARRNPRIAKFDTEAEARAAWRSGERELLRLNDEQLAEIDRRHNADVDALNADDSDKGE